jgi:hypothetical protein
MEGQIEVVNVRNVIEQLHLPRWSPGFSRNYVDSGIGRSNTESSDSKGIKDNYNYSEKELKEDQKFNVESIKSEPYIDKEMIHKRGF